MIEDLILFIAGLLILIGSVFSLVAAIGLVRLPDLYTRTHAASKAGTMGSGLMFVAIAVIAFDGSVILRSLVGLFFLLLTAPVSAHLLARAAYLAGYKPSKMTVIDEFDDNHG